MKWLKMIAAICLISVMNVGCASASGSNYYEAVQKAAEAKALVSEARYRALAQVAASGDGQAASAAVMAIALSNEDTIVPQYVESSALKWAQVLTPTIGTLGLGIVQANVAKNAANKAAEVQMASMQANADIQLGQQTMISNMGSQWADVAAAGGQATVDVALAGFGALNNAGDQTVQLGLAGLDTADSIATTGFTTVDSIATTGFTTVGDVATVGMNNLNDMGQFGMTTVGAVGLAGMDNLTTLGTTGMENMLNLSLDYNDLIDTMNTTNADTLTTTLADANDTNLQGQTNFAQIIANMQATIDAMSSQLNDPITCNVAGDGRVTCNN